MKQMFYNYKNILTHLIRATQYNVIEFADNINSIVVLVYILV